LPSYFFQKVFIGQQWTKITKMKNYYGTGHTECLQLNNDRFNSTYLKKLIDQRNFVTLVIRKNEERGYR